MMLNYQMKQKGYVFRVLALKEIISNPEKYGFVFDK